MKHLPWLGILICVLATPAAMAARTMGPQLPPGVVLPKDVAVPNDTSIAVYLPANQVKNRFYVELGSYWAQPGKALQDSVQATSQLFFTGTSIVTVDDDKSFGLLLVIHPKMKVDGGSLRVDMAYRVYDPKGSKLLEGTQAGTAPIGDLQTGNGFYRAQAQATQLVMVDVLTRLKPSAATFPAGGQVKALNRATFINHDEGVASGTGFYINATGQVMTAAHVIHDCVTVDVRRGEVTTQAQVVASSNLLDLAIINTGTPVTSFLPLRKNVELILGEPVTNVGFPLQKILASSPNLTRGNVSSRGALAGSVGQFQFSAPIQPGSSGGPVVSDGGELLGVTVATLNASKLVEQGLLPQNVNFALEAKYAAMFMRKNNITFSEVPTNLKGDIRIANEAALAAVVSLTCYQ